MKECSFQQNIDDNLIYFDPCLNDVRKNVQLQKDQL